MTFIYKLDQIIEYTKYINYVLKVYNISNLFDTEDIASKVILALKLTPQLDAMCLELYPAWLLHMFLPNP